MSDPRPLTLTDPLNVQHALDVNDAREAGRNIVRFRNHALSQHHDFVKAAAEKEAAYHETRAKAIVELKAEHGATAAPKLADGDKRVRDALIAWRIASGLVDASKERLRGIEGDRSTLKSIIDWSASLNRQGVV